MKAVLGSRWGTELLILPLAALGGMVGYLGFFWLLTQGFFALALPGGLLGIAAGFPKNRWIGWAWICGIAALSLGIYADWKAEPFRADAHFRYFLTHLHLVRPFTLIMIAAGTAVGFWGPFSRYRQSGGQSERPAAF